MALDENDSREVDDTLIGIEGSGYILDKEVILDMFLKAGLDIPKFIQEAFLGYKYRKQNGHLYEETAAIPTMLIKFYYSLNPGEIEFDTMKKNFIRKYVKNECQVEGINPTDEHSKEEVEGLADMYEYLHSPEIDESFGIYSISDLHKKLFGRTAFPEYGGRYRTEHAYIGGSNIGLCEYYMIVHEMRALSGEVDYLHELSKVVRNCGDVNQLLAFIDKVVELKCKLIWIHPFKDGNGRTIRAFVNKLLEDAGLPPIYIKANEKEEYRLAMNLAIRDFDLTSIKAFYRYKICDSILELDIEERYRRGNKEMNDGKKKVKKDGE